MTATVEQIESWIVDVPTIRPHKLSMTTMGCQSLVIVRLTRSDGICGIGEATTIGGLSYGVESPEAISSPKAPSKKKASAKAPATAA